MLQSQSYTRLIGKEVGVTVVKEGKYHEVAETWPVSEYETRLRSPKPPVPVAATATRGADDDPDLAL